MIHTQGNSTFKKEIIALIYASLRGFSQVLLIGNSFSGLLILIGITLFSPVLGMMTFVAAIIGTLTGRAIYVQMLCSYKMASTVLIVFFLPSRQFCF